MIMFLVLHIAVNAEGKRSPGIQIIGSNSSAVQFIQAHVPELEKMFRREGFSINVTSGHQAEISMEVPDSEVQRVLAPYGVAVVQGERVTKGYAREMDEEFYRKQREMMSRVLAENHVVITTAAVPGKKAPTLVTAEMVEGMAPGSVIVDLAAEQGGNCELTEPGEVVVKHGVTLIG